MLSVSEERKQKGTFLLICDSLSGIEQQSRVIWKSMRYDYPPACSHRD